MKAMLVRSKVELDDAYKKISYLRDELQLQQRYFDEQVNVRGDAYEVQNKLESGLITQRELSKKLQTMQSENESATELIKSLRLELKVQEEFFAKQLREQTEYHTSYAQTQIQDATHSQRLLQELQDRQTEILALRRQLASQSTTELFQEQVAVLQIELKKQEQFFSQQEQRLKLENESMQEEVRRMRLMQVEKHGDLDDMLQMAKELKTSNLKLV